MANPLCFLFLFFLFGGLESALLDRPQSFFPKLIYSFVGSFKSFFFFFFLNRGASVAINVAAMPGESPLTGRQK